MSARYAPLFIPPDFTALPPGWTMIERPRMTKLYRKDDKLIRMLGQQIRGFPMSRHAFGVIEYDKPLSDEVAARHQLRRLAP